jgi:glycosyltransferase involved in cell wall biosynthesis
MTARPSVSIVIPTFNEQRHLATTLASVHAQTYANVVEILVADGRSTDRTREIARAHPKVVLVDNPGRIQSAGLNCALAEARGDIVVRVDGHCVLEPDYVERCVAALEETGAAMVGGAMSPEADDHAGATGRAIASAMTSRLGVGPARFHTGGEAGWVDTVYLGAYRLRDVQEVGGYAEDVGVNEDAELAMRMRPRGGIWFDPSIRSSYEPRPSVRAVARQFYRYGRSRAVTARRHPQHVRLRQLAAPALVLGVLSPKRRTIVAVYGATVVVRASLELLRDPAATPAFAVVLPVMHLTWGVGFLQGLVSPPHPSTTRADLAETSESDGAPLDAPLQSGSPRTDPVVQTSGPQGLDEGAPRPSTRVDHRDRPRKMAPDQQQTVA